MGCFESKISSIKKQEQVKDLLQHNEMYKERSIRRSNEYDKKKANFNLTNIEETFINIPLNSL